METIKSNYLILKMVSSISINTVKLHSGNPGELGLNGEVQGGAYQAQPCSFDVGSNGALTLSDDVSFDLSEGDVVGWVSFWESGNFLVASKITEIVMSLDAKMVITKNTVLEVA